MVKILLGLLMLAWAGSAAAQVDYAARLKEGDAVLRDFRFRSGERLARAQDPLRDPRHSAPRCQRARSAMR